MGGERPAVVPPFIRDRYRHDLEFRARVDYVAEHGIPYTEFLDWSADDREIVAVWQQEQRGRCPRCGTFQWEWEEWADADYDDRLQPWHGDHFTCGGCKELDVHGRNLESSKSSKDGVKLALYRSDRGN